MKTAILARTWSWSRNSSQLMPTHRVSLWTFQASATMLHSAWQSPVKQQTFAHSITPPQSVGRIKLCHSRKSTTTSQQGQLHKAHICSGLKSYACIMQLNAIGWIKLCHSRKSLWPYFCSNMSTTRGSTYSTQLLRLEILNVVTTDILR